MNGWLDYISKAMYDIKFSEKELLRNLDDLLTLCSFSYKLGSVAQLVQMLIRVFFNNCEYLETTSGRPFFSLLNLTFAD